MGSNLASITVPRCRSRTPKYNPLLCTIPGHILAHATGRSRDYRRLYLQIPSRVFMVSKRIETIQNDLRYAYNEPGQSSFWKVYHKTHEDTVAQSNCQI